jgi:hypothetical protein
LRCGREVDPACHRGKLSGDGDDSFLGVELNFEHRIVLPDDFVLHQRTYPPKRANCNAISWRAKNAQEMTRIAKRFDWQRR